MKKEIRVINLILIVAIIIAVALISKNTDKKLLEKLQATESKQMASEEDIAIGEKGYVSSVVITQRKTGTGPFDNNDEPGNDSSEDNNIVRSFDQITYTMENTIKLKNEALGESYKGGIIEVKAELPEAIEGYATWDLNSMQWAENAQISNNGRTFTGQYALSKEEVTVPGKQTLIMVLKVLGAPNELEIKPKFTTNLLGNEENEKCIIEDTATTVSATPKMNIQIKRNININYRSYFDDELKDATTSKTATSTYGRMQGYGITLQLYNVDSSKKLKGIELPEGNITFDLTFNELIGTTDVTNQEEYTPKIWDYIENTFTYKGKNQKNLYWKGINTSRYGGNIAPINKITARKIDSCFDGGIWNIEQDNQNSNVYHVTVNNYKFSPDFIFPTRDVEDSDGSATKYGDNIGCFSSGYVQTIMQMPENVGTTSSIYMKATVSNLNFKTISNQEYHNQDHQDEYDRDDISNVNITLYPMGQYSKAQHWHYDRGTINSNTDSNISPSYIGGDAYITQGSTVVLSSQVSSDQSNDGIVKRINVLQKFDDEAFELLENADNSSSMQLITVNLESTKGTLNTLYAAKPNKEGWTSDDEMQNAEEDDLIYFSSYQELKEQGYICVGVLHENTNINSYPGSNYYYGIKLHVKDSAQIGTVYQTINNAKVWLEDEDFTWLGKEYTYDETNGLQYQNINYPTPYYYEYNGMNDNVKSYVKTAYDEGGQIVTGTHFGGYRSGNSLLIIGADLNVNKEVSDKNTDNSKKINYDLGKGEVYVNYKITPSVTNEFATQAITGINTKITDRLPKGLAYVAGSANAGEPDITENPDGSTTLVWYKYNCTVNEPIEPITYTAHINEETTNGTQFETPVVIEEIIADGERSKIGNGLKKDRTSTCTIQIINLASYSLFKTTDTPIIEANGDAHFKVTAINKTDDDVNVFQLLDILPYNGDGRETNFNGNYTVSKIVLKQTSSVNENTISNDNLKLFITEDESVRNGVTVKDTGLGTGNIWSEESSNNEINKELKGYAVTGTLLGKTKLEIDIYVKTNGNKPQDIYQNSATGQTNIETEEIRSPIVKVQVVKRKIDGKVWFDSNKNGVIDNTENYLKDIQVTLIKADGTKAKDINGNEIPNVVTNADGYYKFEDMVKGEYKIQVAMPTEEIKEFTLKGVGANEEINSKVNTDGITDTITKLNTISSPIIEVNNVNAGITYKDTSVKVHHYIEGTTTKLSEGILLEGKVKDEYETNVATDIPEYYELISVPGNAKGEMTLKPIEVIYYYRLKKYPYTVNYIDKDTNEVIHTAKTETNKAYQTEIQSRNEIININKYDYDSADKETLTIGTDGSKNQITLYYTKKKGTVTTKYIDKNTGAEISEQTKTTDKVDKDYTTTKKDITGYTYVEDTQNTQGTYTVEPIEVIYYYKKNTKVTVKYIDKITGQEIPQKNEATGENETSREVKNGLVGDEYTSHSKNFDNYVLVESPRSEKVTMTPEEITLIYYYSHVSGGVIEKHIDDITGDILYNETHTGKEGDSYNIPSKTFEGYELVQEKLPNNSQGTMTIEPKEVKYYYKYKTKVTVKYIDKITGQEIPQKNEQTGEEETSKETKEGYEGDNYTTENKNFEEYDLIEIPVNNEGKMTKDEIEVTYYYVHKSAGVIVKYIDIITGEEIPEIEEGKTKESQEKIEGHEGDTYKTTEKKFEKYEIVEEKYPENAEGTMTIEPKEVKYYYIQKTEVEVKYVDILTEEEIKVIDKETGEKKETKEIINGYEGEEYKTEAKVIEGYEIVEEKLPENPEGKMTKDKIEVIYYYKRPAKVVVNYYDIDTNEKLTEEEIIKGHQDDEYKTEAKDIKYYNLVKEKLPENAEGKMTVEIIEEEIENEDNDEEKSTQEGEDGSENKKKTKQIVKDTIEVNYYYKKKAFNLKVEKTISKIVENGEERLNKAEIAKVDIHRKKVEQTNLQIIYNIKVTNDSELKGKAKLQEIIPAGMKMQVENNKVWQIQGSTANLETEEIEPGESVIYVVVLDWINGESSLGMKTNNVEIISTENESGFNETNKEDNKDKADLIITISTGVKNIATAIIIALIILIFFTSGIARKLRIKIKKNI